MRFVVGEAILPWRCMHLVWGCKNGATFFLTSSSHCFLSGKTTLLSVLAHGEPVETVPTIGLNVKVFKKGKVNMKCWDIGACVEKKKMNESFGNRKPIRGGSIESRESQ